MHGKHRLGRYSGHHRGFQVFASREGAELFNVFFSHHYGHSFLRFAYGKFGSVQSLVLLRDFIQIYFQAVGQFSYGDGNSAGAEVVAALYQL